MRSRFPHGGEVLGAAPANPILAPVLSKDLSLSISRQRDLLDLQAIQRIPGLVGYWKSDPAYLYEDSAGTTPASTSGTGPVGQWQSVGNTPSLGPVLNTYSDCEAGLPLAKSDGNGSVSTLTLNTNNPISGTQDARLVVTTSALNRPTLTFAGHSVSNNVTGATYRIQFQYKVNSGTFQIYQVQNGSTAVIISIPLTGTGTFIYDVTCAGTAATVGTLYCGDSVCDVQLDNVKIQQLTGITAYQSTTANKPILRKTPTTGVYWADSNTSTSALNVALGNLGSACTVARSGAEGVTFTEGVTISSTYNLAPAFAFNTDVAIFNRALTTIEKALITRYMQRAVPQLGSNLVTNGNFDTDTTGWNPGTSAQLSLSSGYMRVANNGAANQYAQQPIPALSTSKYYFASCLCKGDDGTGKGRFLLGSSGKQRDGTVSSSPQVLQVVGAPNAGAIYLFCLSATTTGVYAEFDNVTAQEIL